MKPPFTHCDNSTRTYARVVRRRTDLAGIGPKSDMPNDRSSNHFFRNLVQEQFFYCLTTCVAKSTRLHVALAALGLTMTMPTFAQDSFTRAKRMSSQRFDRYGDLSLGAVVRTDERYGHDGLIQGPRGWDYWNLLEKPKDYQNPNLWPDKRPPLVGRIWPAGISHRTVARGTHSASEPIAQSSHATTPFTS